EHPEPGPLHHVRDVVDVPAHAAVHADAHRALRRFLRRDARRQQVAGRHRPRVMGSELTLVEAAERGPWNAFVEACPHGHFFQTWEWGELQADLQGPPTRPAATRGEPLAGPR